eukprot:gene6096-8260_t
MEEPVARVPEDAIVAPSESDPRLTLIYEESIRALHHQQSFVENMNSRAGSLIFATAFANSLLGSRALADGLGTWDWIAASLLFVIGALIVFMLWPYHRYSFSFDPEDLLRTYVDGERAATLSEMHRALALRLKSDMASNWRIISRLRTALQVGLIALLLNILAWFSAIASGARRLGAAARGPYAGCPFRAVEMQLAGIGRVVFWEGGSLWLALITAPGSLHFHHAVQISLPLSGTVRFRRSQSTDWQDYPGAVIAPDLPHAFDAPERVVANILFEPESLSGR